MNAYTLISGAALGSEKKFGEEAEKYGIAEVNFTFDGHDDHRDRGLKVLNTDDLAKSCVSLHEVSNIMHRKYPDTPTFKKILQTIWFLVEEGEEIFVIGKILPDNTIKGGTGWAAEFAKQSNKPLFVFDQEQDSWFEWNSNQWQEAIDLKITKSRFTGTGSRNLRENGIKAIEELFKNSF